MKIKTPPATEASLFYSLVFLSTRLRPAEGRALRIAAKLPFRVCFNSRARVGRARALKKPWLRAALLLSLRGPPPPCPS